MSYIPFSADLNQDESIIFINSANYMIGKGSFKFLRLSNGWNMLKMCLALQKCQARVAMRAKWGFMWAKRAIMRVKSADMRQKRLEIHLIAIFEPCFC